MIRLIPIFLLVCASAAGVVGFRPLVWDPVANADYYVVSNAPSGICTTSKLTHVTAGLTRGTNVLRVRAVSRWGVESDWSTNLTVVVDNIQK